MRFAYADPPYLGMCKRYDHEHGDGGCWDDERTHRRLILDLGDYDGWALSASSVSLQTLLRLCPPGVRVSPWVKPFGIYKPGVNPAYVWEPVIWKPAYTSLGRDVDTVRDWVSANVTLKRGLVGAKPDAFCDWLLDLLGVKPDDEFFDLFPGTGSMSRALERLAA